MKRTVLAHTLAGVVFGLLFPIASFLILAFENNLPLNPNALPTSLATAHQLSTLQWIIDTAPFFLGLFAYWIGKRQEQVLLANQALSGSLLQREEMIEQLEQVRATLEENIRTTATQLGTAAEIAQQANAIRQPAELLGRVVDLISEQFGFYHVGIFLNDRENRFTVLQAANSTGGQRMLARGHRLAIGETGFVGYVASRGESRIALDVGQDAVYFDNPDLPNTRSEMALPLRVSGRTIGVLDIQSTQAQAFSDADLTVAQIIADSLASAIENAQLFAEVQANLEEIRSLNRQYMQRIWTQELSIPERLEYTYTAPARKSEREIPGPEEHPQAQPEAVEDDFQEPTSTAAVSAAAARILEIPIRLRDQPIGSLRMEAGARQEAGSAATEWLPDELALIEAVTTQAALALENTRLLEETQRRADLERLSADITARLWSSSEPQAILRTALQELGDALGASEGLIELEVDE